MAKTYFEQITASQEALAEFLASIPALDTPWDGLFQRTYCAACSAENCDAENCPHQAERNSPAWFLAQHILFTTRVEIGWYVVYVWCMHTHVS